MNKLVGCTIALPSSTDLNAMAQLTERLGGTVLRFAAKTGGVDGFSATSNGSPNPTEKLPYDDGSSARLALENWLEPLVNDFDDIVVLSPQGIRLLVELANQLHREGHLMRALAGVRRIAYGSRPAVALRELGLPADIVAEQPSLSCLSAALEPVDLSGRAVGLIPRATDPDLVELIAAKGGLPRILAPLDHAAVSPTSTLIANVISARVRAVVFTSAEQVRDIWRLACRHHPADDFRKALGTIHVIAVGSTTARALEQNGIAVHTTLASSELACASPKQMSGLLERLGDGPLVEARSDVAADRHDDATGDSTLNVARRAPKQAAFEGSELLAAA